MSSQADYDVVGCGSMAVDDIQLAPRIGGPDEKVLLGDGVRAPSLVGGVTLNHLGWARALGVRTGIFGKQADDAHGRFLRAAMARIGIDAHIDLSGSASSHCQIFVDPAGARAIYMARGATAELLPEEIDARHRAVIERAAWVTTEISQLPLPAVRRILEVARECGARTVLDLDVPATEAIEGLGSEEDLMAALGLADVLKPSASALVGLVEGRTAEDLARAAAQKLGTEVVALTDGEHGSVVYAGGEIVRAPAPRIEMLDSTGAGDAYLGGLVAARVRGLDWSDAAKLGNACGGACCEQIGAFPADPAAARARVRELFEQLGGPHLDWLAAPAESAGEDALDAYLQTAQRELARADATLDRDAVRAAATLIEAVEADGGRVHVTGIGKPAHLAQYAASLLASTGTPATFLHATEATHGSVGQLRAGDALIAISNSGTTRELLDTTGAAAAFGARLIAITRDPQSPLARAADLTLIARVDHEGGPLDLAPRASILAQTLVLTALSVELQHRKALTRDAYHQRHPAGALGQKTRNEG